MGKTTPLLLTWDIANCCLY